MIREELLPDDLIRHYSDEMKRIRQIETNTVYDEAVDVIPCRYTYEETDEYIGGDEDATPEEALAALEAIL